jgi:spore maturation protein CgeB
MKLVVFGLSLSSSWGNGHATTYRALLRAFFARGHEVVFYEWDAPWYRGEHRDLTEPDFCRLEIYEAWERVRSRALAEAAEADAVLVGSFVHRGSEVIDELLELPSAPVSFYDIDTPVTVARLRAGDTDYLRRDQVPYLAQYLSFTGGPLLSEVLGVQLGARFAAVLYCSVDAERYRPVATDAEMTADLAYMGTHAADRQPVLERLLLGPARDLPGRRFLVAGPQYPDTARWPANVTHLAHLPPSRHPAFYSSSAWQLNATRADMAAAGWSPSVRLFEAGACAAAVISDRWPGIEEFFVPGVEILLPETTQEAVEILTSTHPADREALGAAFRTRVLRDHTSQRRAEELETLLLGVSAPTT